MANPVKSKNQKNGFSDFFSETDPNGGRTLSERMSDKWMSVKQLWLTRPIKALPNGPSVIMMGVPGWEGWDISLSEMGCKVTVKGKTIHIPFSQVEAWEPCKAGE